MSISLFSLKKGKPTNLIEGNIGVCRLQLFSLSVTHPMALEVGGGICVGSSGGESFKFGL